MMKTERDSAPTNAADGPEAKLAKGRTRIEPPETGLSGHDVTRLYVAEQARLYNVVRRRIGDPDDAADLVQDAFARLMQARPQAALRTPVAYLQRIVRNLLHDRSKRADRRLVARDVTFSDAEMPFVPPQQEWAIAVDDLMTSYAAAVAALSPRTREVFVLHRVDGLRYRQIAEQLGISVATVEYHMARALVLLDKALDR